MKFLFPYFLFALSAITIPIVIHLFNFRRFKTVYFSNIEFLKNIKKESQRKSKLKQILILIARILAVICLVLAFAQPYIPAANQQKVASSQVVGVYIDNSFSMNSRGEQGLLLETARNKAIEIAREYKPGTRFMLGTNDQLAKHRNLMNSEQFIQEVTEIEVSPNVVVMSAIYSRMKELMSQSNRKADKILYFLSDYQREAADLEKFEPDTTVSVYLFPLLAQAAGNLYIDSCWFESPSRKLGGEEELFIRIKNQSDQDYQDLPLRFYLNDSLKSLTNYSIGARGEIKASLRFSNFLGGFQSGRVELTDYPVTHDNTWFLSYKVEPEVKVLVIYNESGLNDGSSYFRALFSGDGYTKADFTGSKSIRSSSIGDYNTIILTNPDEVPGGLATELAQAVSDGASLLFFPKLNGDVQSYNQLLAMIGANTVSGVDTASQNLAGVDYNHPVYVGVFKEMDDNSRLPAIKGHLKFTSQTRIAEPSLLWFRNGEMALGSVNFGNGKVYVFSFPIDKRNETFAKDILFVPTIYSLVLNSIASQQVSYTIGKDDYILLPQNLFSSGYSKMVVRNLKTNEEFIPEVLASDRNKLRIALSGRILEAGYYSLETDGLRVALPAFNYNRAESDLRCYTAGELDEKVLESKAQITVIKNTGSQFSEILDEIQNGRQLWKWFIALALLFIAVEAAIIRFWKS